jgi:uncharacterized protein YndB with AHSA1/START domain
MAAKNKPNELYINRVYDAPVAAVWDAWTDPKQAAKWWGPRGFTITTHSKDLKPGGHWHYTMHGPDGTDYPNKTKYFEVEKHKKLVYDHGANDEQAPLFRVTVEFSENKGKTKMEMTMTLPTPEAARETAKFNKKAGGNSTWDRLAEYLEKESSGKEKFVVNRSFDTDIETMYEMWTDPKHFEKWLPPAGMDMEFVRADLRPGGSTFYFMHGNNVKMYGRTEYLNFDKPHGLAYVQEFCDEHEKPARHPMMPTWPAKMLTTVQLSEEGPGKTRVTITWEPAGDVTKEELETFIKMRGGMSQGWGGSFDKLEGYLANR